MRKIKPIVFRKSFTYKKGWGKEVSITNCNLRPEESSTGYSGKLLIYDVGRVSSMHYHLDKSETFYILSGEVEFGCYDPETAQKFLKILKAGDVVDIPVGNPHQVSCLKAAVIVEFATPDDRLDNYRIIPGDSQRNEEPKVSTIYGECVHPFSPEQID